MFVNVCADDDVVVYNIGVYIHHVCLVNDLKYD